MQKHKEYYRKFNIFTLIYTDSDLQNLDQIFKEMQQYLKPEHENRQILEATLEGIQTVFFIESTLIPSPYQNAFFINTGHVAADVISSAAPFQTATALLGCDLVLQTCNHCIFCSHHPAKKPVLTSVKDRFLSILTVIIVHRGYGVFPARSRLKRICNS